MRLFVDMDGTLAQWQNVEAMEMLYEKGYYHNLLPMEKVVEQIRSAINSGVEVYSLSSYLTDSEYALKEKNAWLDEYLPELQPENRIFVKYGDDKSKYIEGGITERDYLLDDYTPNLLLWEQAGGKGIKMLNDLNHTKKTWEGMFVHHDSDMIYSLIMTECQRVETKDKEIKPVEDNTRFNKKYLDLMAELKQKQNELMKSMHSVSFAKNEAEILSKQREVDKVLSDMISENNKYEIQLYSYFYDKNSDTSYVNYGVLDKEKKCLLSSYIMCEGETVSNEKVLENIWSNSDMIYPLNDLSPLTQRLVHEAGITESFAGITLSYRELLDRCDGNMEEVQKFIEEVEDKELPINLHKDVYDNDLIEIHFDDNELLCCINYHDDKEFPYEKADASEGDLLEHQQEENEVEEEYER